MALRFGHAYTVPPTLPFEITVTNISFTYQRKTEQIDAEAALNGIYVCVPTSPTSNSDRRCGPFLREPRTGRARVPDPQKPRASDPPDPPPPHRARPRARVPLNARVLPH